MTENKVQAQQINLKHDNPLQNISDERQWILESEQITEQLNQPEAHNYDEHIHTYENCCLVRKCPLCSGTPQLTSVFIELLNGTHFKKVLHSTAATSKLRFASWCDMPKLDKHMEPYKRCSVIHLTCMHSQIHAKRSRGGQRVGWVTGTFSP